MPAFAPIVLFTYNRLKNTRETVSCLLANKEASGSDLIVFSDAPKSAQAEGSVREVRAYLHTIAGFKSVRIVERDRNFGLVKNIVSGVTEIVGEYGRVIVLEDDHSVSPFFLQYMNEGLDRLEQRDDIVCIHGYVYPHKRPLPETFLVKGADCWGWATWKRGWDLFDMDAAHLFREIERQGRGRAFDFGGSYPYLQMLKDQADGKAGSWAICWYASAFLQDKYTVYPNSSLVRINSLEDGGDHETASPYMLLYQVALKATPVDWDAGSLDVESLAGRKAFTSFYRSRRSLWRKGRVYLKNRIHRLFVVWK